ncbi:MAG: DNA internalization-related competence protein ComEC/Rec2 [Clostridia bacterium]|nr:DNA internalization-related competence protein ComEC/Rec2 [Clostridia bacterium]
MSARRGDPAGRWMSARPLALLAACFLAGVVAGRAVPDATPVWGALALAAALTLALFRKRTLAFALAVMLGALHMSLFLVKPDVSRAEGVRLTGYVDAEPRKTDKALRLRLSRAEIDGEPLPCRVMLYLYDMEAIPACGDRVTATVDTWTPRGAGNPGGFDYAAWLWRQRVALCASAGADSVLSVDPPDSFSLPRWTQVLRGRVAAVIRGAFSEAGAGVALALVAGDRSEMSEELRDNYRASGVAHLLALSGLHVGVLMAALEWALRRLRLSRKASFLVTLPVMAVYALLVGLPASVLRACLMYAAARLARLEGRPRDGLSLIALSMLPMLLADPLCIEDAGFILSYSAAAGLALFARPWPERASMHRSLPARCGAKLLAALRVSLAAQAGALPAMICLYNQIPLWFLPFNLALGPLVALLFPLLLTAVALSALCPALAAPFVWVSERLVAFLSAATALGARLPLALVNASDWPAWLIALYAAAALCASPYVRFTRAGRRRAWARAAMPALVALGLLLPRLGGQSGLEITFVDVGQGDGAVIRAQGRTYLVDTGDGSAMAEYLLNRGLEPEGVFLSHGHSDHVGGLLALVDDFPPCPIYVSAAWDGEPPDEAVALAWEKATAAGWPVVRLRAGDELLLSPDVTMTVWHPGGPEAHGLNETSMVCSVSYGESTALFTGDLPMAQEFIPLPRCTVLKVAHHGSKYATGALLLDQARPDAAVISVGHNSFGHPAPEVLARLEGAAVYRTDERGAVTVVLGKDGSTRVTTWLSEGEP